MYSFTTLGLKKNKEKKSQNCIILETFFLYSVYFFNSTIIVSYGRKVSSLKS